MLLCCRLTEFAWSVHDGKKLLKHDQPSDSSENETRKRKMAIVKFPSLLEYYAFCFNFAGFLTGPFLEFADYLDFVKRTCLPETSNDAIPFEWQPVLFKIAFGLLNIVGMKLSDVYSESFAATTEFVTNYSFLGRLFYLFISVELSYCKYYFAWSLGEGAAIATGMSYSGKDQNQKNLW